MKTKLTNWLGKEGLRQSEKEFYEQQLDQLKAENENWQKEYWKLEQGNDFLAEKNSKLKGCLTEIKEIAEKTYKTPLAEKDCIDCDGYLQQILQKISECEVEND